MRYRQAVSAMQAGRLEEAAQLAEVNLIDDQDSPTLHCLLAAVSASCGEPERAYAHLMEALATDILYPDAHYLLALLQMEEGDRVAARSSLRAAIYCRPDFALAHLVSGDLFEQEGDHRRAVRAWITARRFAADLPADLLLSDVADVTAGQLVALVNTRLGKAE
jgi:Tfp pilus assembly protein PilF